MRKKLLITIMLIVVSGLFIVIKVNFKKTQESELYKKFKYPYTEKCFGKDLYSEIDYLCTDEEWQIGQEVIDDVYEYVENATLHKESFEEIEILSRYVRNKAPDYYTKEETFFRQYTCKIDGEKGHIWLTVTRRLMNKNETKTYAYYKQDLTLWYIEKKDDKWQIVHIQEMP